MDEDLSICSSDEFFGENVEMEGLTADSNKNNTVCLHNVPGGWLLNNYESLQCVLNHLKVGKIQRISTFSGNDKTRPLVFVELETIEHAEKALLYFNENKDMGIKVVFAKKKNEIMSRRFNIPSQIENKEAEIKLPIIESINLATVGRTILSYVEPAELEEIDPTLNFLTFNNYYLNKDISEPTKNLGWQISNGRLLFVECPEMLKKLEGLKNDSKKEIEKDRAKLKYFNTAPKCFICDQVTFLQCTCCSQYCCSITCQRLSKNHKEHTKPEIENEIPEIEIDIIKCINMPAYRSSVALTSVINANTVYVRSLVSDLDTAYIKLLNDVKIFDLKTSGIRLHCTPKIGEIILAKFKGDNFYYRAIVLKYVNEHEIYVAYLEFGNVMMVDMDSLKPISKELQNAPVFINRVMLTNISGEYNIIETISYLELLLRGRIKLNIDLREGNNTKVDNRACDLIIPLQNKSINAKINSFYQMELLSASSSNIFFYENMICTIYTSKEKKKNIKSIRIINLSLMCSNFLYFVNDDDWDDYLNIHKMIEHFAELIEGSSFNESYVPRVGEVCMVKIKEKWYRAANEEHANVYHILHLIDYGISVPAKFNNIRKIPYALFKLPNYLHDARLAELPPILNQAQLQCLEKILPLYEPALRLKNIEFFVIEGLTDETCMDITFNDELHNMIINELKLLVSE